jgi:hypothetical protein
MHRPEMMGHTEAHAKIPKPSDARTACQARTLVVHYRYGVRATAPAARMCERASNASRPGAAIQARTQTGGATLLQPTPTDKTNGTVTGPVVTPAESHAMLTKSSLINAVQS